MSKQTSAKTHNFGRMSIKEKTTSNLQLTDCSLVSGEGGQLCFMWHHNSKTYGGSGGIRRRILTTLLYEGLSGQIQCLYRFTCEEKDPVTNGQKSGFGGLEVACSPLVPKFAGSHPGEAVGFLGRKNPQHAFLRRGSKAVGPMS